MEKAARGLDKAGTALADAYTLTRHVLPQWFNLAERLVDQVERAVDEAELAVDLAYETASKEPPTRKPRPNRAKD